MMPGINSRKMQQMMRQMGIQQVEIPATEVIIRMPDKEIVVTDPQVSKVNMMGQVTLQVIGEMHERPLSEKQTPISEEDVKTVATQAGVSASKARDALQQAKGDLADAILQLQKEHK
ncbi:nascent polypeptide-associated complex protein [Candidatus Woesearchaeota archaeon]|nr:nascent polypeptide-associated complex protein [Candidatus Woesearchaeota archaeon]